MMLKARFVVPVDAPVIENGAVVVEGDRIAAVGTARELHSPPVTDCGDSVICPGFVNAHTHLELSPLAGRVPPGHDFVDWLRRLFAAINALPSTREAVQRAVRAGITASLRYGVTMVGDITRTPEWTREVLAASTMRGVSFGEVIAIGSRRHLLAQRLDAAASPDRETFALRVGISPHAPYTVELRAMRACAQRARASGGLQPSRSRASSIPICVHVAETADEELFTRSCEGPFVEYLRGLGVWDDGISAAGCGPVELVQRAGLLGNRTVIAHANYVTDDDINRIAASGASVAYCPRTHRAFEHAPHRFRDMLAAGINVGIGTDSLASNPSLSILDELRFLRREHSDLPCGRILAMGTIRGARALGLEEVAGSLTPGKTADFVVTPLDTSSADVGWDSILGSTVSPIAVYVKGKLIRQPADGMYD